MREDETRFIYAVHDINTMNPEFDRTVVDPCVIDNSFPMFTTPNKGAGIFDFSRGAASVVRRRRPSSSAAVAAVALPRPSSSSCHRRATIVPSSCHRRRRGRGRGRAGSAALAAAAASAVSDALTRPARAGSSSRSPARTTSSSTMNRAATTSSPRARGTGTALPIRVTARLGNSLLAASRPRCSWAASTRSRWSSRTTRSSTRRRGRAGPLGRVVRVRTRGVPSRGAPGRDRGAARVARRRDRETARRRSRRGTPRPQRRRDAETAETPRRRDRRDAETSRP